MQKFIFTLIITALTSINIAWAAGYPLNMTNHHSTQNMMTNHSNILPYTPFYLGVKVGYANLHYSKTWLRKLPGFKNAKVRSIDENGIAPRIFGGYYINQYIAAELGYTYLPYIEFTDTNNTTIDEKFTQEIYDGLLKFEVSNNKLNLFAKIGAAWIYRNDFKMIVDGNTVKSNLTRSNVVPVAGVGAGLRLTRHILTEISWLHYFPNNTLKAIDFYGLNFIYRF